MLQFIPGVKCLLYWVLGSIMSLKFEQYLEQEYTLGPDARFLLEVIVAESECAGRQPLRVKELAKTLCLDERVVSAGLNELVAAGVLERLIAPRGGRVGRGKVTYMLCPANGNRSANRVYLWHAELLQALFSGADMAFPVLGAELIRKGRLGEPAESGDDDNAAKLKRGRHRLSGGQGRLSVRNRLLFAVLLSRSDRFGEVQIGVPRLAQLTGMKAEQVKTRLNRLMLLGLIRRHMPGLSSKVFALGRVESTYFLNIDALEPQETIVIHIAPDTEDKKFTHADQLRGDCLKGTSRNRTSPDCLVRLFSGQPMSVFLHFQYRLYSYASHLLSHHWQKLQLGEPIEDDELAARIERDFVRTPTPAMTSEIARELEARVDGEAAASLRDGAGGEAGQTCACIYEWAIQIAVAYRERFGQLSKVDFEKGEIRILPGMSDIGYKAITVLSQPRHWRLGRFSVFAEGVRGTLERWPARNESELHLQNRMDFGLASLPVKERRALGLK